VLQRFASSYGVLVVGAFERCNGLIIRGGINDTFGKCVSACFVLG